MLFQLGETLMAAVPANQLRVEGLLGIKRLPVLEDAVNGASKLLGDDREGFGLAVFADQPLVELFGWAVGSEEQTGSLTESPLEVDVADLGVLGALVLAGRLACGFDQAAVGDEVTDGGETADIVDFIDHHQGEDLADAGNGAQQAEHHGVMVACLLEHLALELEENGVVDIEEHHVGFDALADHGIGEQLGQADAVGVSVDAFGEPRQVVLGVGVLDVGSAVRTDV